MKRTSTIITLLLLLTMVGTGQAWAETIDGVKYIDANGVEQTKDGVTVLTGGGSDDIFLAGGWYVVNSNISYSATIYLQGEVHLILADGKTMNIGTSGSPINGNGIIYPSYNSGYSLTIYGQSGCTGALNIYVTVDKNNRAICAHNVTINGGQVTATGNTAISALVNVNINGGQVEATGGTGEDDYGICSSGGDIILGWKNTTDFIKASRYHIGVQTAEGKSFVAYDGENTTAFVSGTVDDVTILAGKTLKPLDGPVVSIGSEYFSFDKDADFVIGDTRYYKYAANANVTLSYTGYGFVQVTGATLNAVENQPMQRSFTMPATDVALTATAVTGLTATAVTYDGEAHVPVIKQGENAFAAANYAIAYKLGENDVTAADVKDVNTYTCTLTGLGQYVGTTSVDFTIDKTDYVQQDITKYVPSDKSGSITIDLPELPEGASYSCDIAEGDNENAVISNAPTITSGKLTFTTNSGKAAGTTAEITVAATGADNYNDYSFKVNVVVSEYTVAYAWPKQTNIYLIGTDLEKDAETAQALHKNELQWAEGGITLNQSLLTVKKNGTAVTNYTAKVGETVLGSGANTLTLDPGAHRIAITGANGQLDDWVDFSVIKLIENDPDFKIIAEDGPAHPRLDSNHQDDFPTIVPVTVTYQGQDVTDNDNTTYWLKHDFNNPCKIYYYSELYEYNPDYNSPLIYPSTYGGAQTTIMAGVDGEKYAVYNLGTGNTVAYNEIYCVDKIVGERIWHHVGEEIKTLRDDDGNPVSSGVEGGHIYYVGDYCPDFYLKDGRVYLGDVQMAEYDPDANLSGEGVYVDEYLTIGPNHLLHDGKDIFYLEGSAIYKYSNFYDLGGTTNFSVPGSTDCHSLRDGDVESFSQNGTTITINGKSFQLGERIILGQTFISTGSTFIATGDNVPTVDAQNENIIHVGDYQINAQGRIIFCAYSLIGTDSGTSKGYWPYCAYVKYRLDDYCYLIGRDDFLAYSVESGVKFEYDQEHNVGGTPVFTVGEEVKITVKTFGYPSTVYEGEDKYGSTGDLYIFLNDVQYGGPHYFNPSCSHDISFDNLSEGTYVVRAELDKDQRHLKSTGIFTFKVVRTDPVLTLTGKQNTAGEAFKTGANIEYDPENPIVVNAVNDKEVSGTNWRWTISDPTVVTKNKVVKSEENEPNSEDIYLNTMGLGTVTLKARFSGNDLYNPAKEAITFTVVPKNVTSPIIKLVSDETIYYDGQEKKPEVKVYYAEDKLIPTDQYTVTYDNNINASSTDSKAKIIVKSKTGALYTIDAEKEFDIQETAVTITEVPTASVISDGKTLAASTLKGGKAKAGEMDVDGTFTWTDATTVADINVAEYDVTFTPDNKNFKLGECKVTLTVMPRAMLFAANTTNLWATFCGQNDYELPEGCTAYTISSISGSTVTISEVTAEEENTPVIIPAYTPMLIQRGENIAAPVTAAFSAIVTAPASGYDAQTGLATTTGSGFTFYGNAGDEGIGADNATFIKAAGYTSYVLRNGQFILVDQNTGLAAHRCLLNVNTNEYQAPKMLTISKADVTGVIEVKEVNASLEVKDNSWYTLDGRKLNGKPTAKGIYIYKGKKVVVK